MAKTFLTIAIFIFKTLALSKTFLDNQIITLFLRGNSTPKLKHDTICNYYKDDGLKNADIR